MAKLCGCDTTKYNIDDFREFDYAKRYGPGELVTFQGTLWKSHNVNGAAGYTPTLNNSIFLPVSPDECYDTTEPECNIAPYELEPEVPDLPSSMPSFSLPDLSGISQQTLVLGGVGVLMLIILLK